MVLVIQPLHCYKYSCCDGEFWTVTYFLHSEIESQISIRIWRVYFLINFLIIFNVISKYFLINFKRYKNNTKVKYRLEDTHRLITHLDWLNRNKQCKDVQMTLIHFLVFFNQIFQICKSCIQQLAGSQILHILEMQIQIH